jgi:acyl-CoA dehydrogenase
MVLGQLPTVDSDSLGPIRAEIQRICAGFPDRYWQDLDAREEYPTEFVSELRSGGWLGPLIPTDYGGAGLGIREAGAILEEINASGGNGAAVHAQLYIMGSLLRYGSDEQKQRYLPGIAAGDLSLQAFGVTEPTSGSDTSSITTYAKRVEGGYLVNGQKIFISRVQHSDLMLLLARTTALEAVSKRSQGMTLFLVDLRQAGDSIEVRKIGTMVNHETNELFIRDLFVPEAGRIGREGDGFKYLLASLNAERILIGFECLGDGRYLLQKAVDHANQREVFGRPIGANQGVQFPIAKAWMRLRAARAVCDVAAASYDAGNPNGADANTAKWLCADASWEAANVAMDTLGGYGMAREFGVERKFRETRLYQVAPVTNNMILAYIGQNVLGLPRSY